MTGFAHLPSRRLLADRISGSAKTKKLTYRQDSH
jgi:hypothetical protein